MMGRRSQEHSTVLNTILRNHATFMTWQTVVSFHSWCSSGWFTSHSWLVG
jgi:hypothetical protein